MKHALFLDLITDYLKGRDVAVSDKFAVNEKFKNPHKRVKINQIQLRETVSVTWCTAIMAVKKRVHCLTHVMHSAWLDVLWFPKLQPLLQPYAAVGERADGNPRESVPRPNFYGECCSETSEALTATLGRRSSGSFNENKEENETHIVDDRALQYLTVPCEGWFNHTASCSLVEMIQVCLKSLVTAQQKSV